MKPECVKDINVLHKTQINENLTVYIGQHINHKYEDVFERSQYMAIVIHDEKNNQHIRLRMSSMRKIFNWVKKKHWDKSRRLSWFEKLILCKQAKDVYEDMVPDYTKLAKQKQKEREQGRTNNKLAAIREGMHKDIERLHKISDEDFYSAIGEDLKKRIKEAEKKIGELGNIVIKE